MSGGYLTDAPTYMTYYSVVSFYTVHIGFLMSVLDNLGVLAGDIKKYFPEDTTKEKLLFYAGDEWKADKDKVVIFVRELYGLKYLALQFRNC